MNNPFHNIAQIALGFRVILPSPRHWWLVKEPKAGEVNALYNIRGIAVATNGIMLCLYKENGTIEFCHRDWFIPDKNERLDLSDDSNGDDNNNANNARIRKQQTEATKAALEKARLLEYV